MRHLERHRTERSAGCAPRCSARTTASCRPPASWSASPRPARAAATSSSPASPAWWPGAMSMAAGEYVSVSSQAEPSRPTSRARRQELATRRGRPSTTSCGNLRAARPRARAGADRSPTADGATTRSARTRATSSASDRGLPRVHAGGAGLRGCVLGRRGRARPDIGSCRSAR